MIGPIIDVGRATLTGYASNPDVAVTTGFGVRWASYYVGIEAMQAKSSKALDSIMNLAGIAGAKNLTVLSFNFRVLEAAGPQREPALTSPF